MYKFPPPWYKCNNSDCLLFCFHIIAALIALAVPDLDDLISLIGAVASSGLALIFPPLLSILVFWRIRHKCHWLGCFPWPVWVVKDVLIATLGVVGSLFGTYAAIRRIVLYFRQELHSDGC